MNLQVRTPVDFVDVLGLSPNKSGAHAILIEQFYKKPTELSPQKRLMLAIIEDALKVIEDYAKHKKHPLLAREAFEWVNDEESEEVFGFVRCCEELNLNVSAVRKAINRKWGKRAKTNKVQRAD